MTVSHSAPRRETVRAVSGTPRPRQDAIEELADAIERSFRAEHVFIAAGDPAPLVAALWRRALRAGPAQDGAAPEAYDLVVVLAPAGADALPAALLARTDTVLLVDGGRAAEPAGSLLAIVEHFAERSFDLDPLTEVPLAGARGLVFRRVDRPLPPPVRRAYARLLGRAAGPEREAELTAARERLSALEHEVVSLRTQADVERSDRLRAEADVRRVVDALAEANDALAEQLDAARTARLELDRDLQGLLGSRLWRLKLAVARRLGRAAAR